MLSGVGCVAKRSSDVGVFGVPEDAGHGGFQGGEEEQEKVIVVRHGRRVGWMLDGSVWMMGSDLWRIWWLLFLEQSGKNRRDLLLPAGWCTNGETALVFGVLWWCVD